VIYFYPVFDGCAYFGGGGNHVFIPWLLEYGPARFVMNMPVGASFNVYLHEMFHGFESACRISPSHAFSRQHEKDWPAWYRDLVTKEGRPVEWKYYERIFTEKIVPDASFRLPGKTAKHPEAGIFTVAKKFLALHGEKKEIRCCRKSSRSGRG
jgi:hypothetical protein